MHQLVRVSGWYLQVCCFVQAQQTKGTGLESECALLQWAWQVVPYPARMHSVCPTSTYLGVQVESVENHKQDKPTCDDPCGVKLGKGAKNVEIERWPDVDVELLFVVMMTALVRLQSAMLRWTL